MKILVTGGAGYIGSELVFKLAQNDKVKEIIVYDNLSGGNHNLFISHSNKLNNKVRFVLGDILDSRLLMKTIKGVEVVYHLAAKVASPYKNEDSHHFEQVNNWGTSEIALAVEENKSVKHLIYVSSMGVYGSTSKDDPATEKTEVNPKTFYGVSKMRGENHVSRLSEKIKVHIIRAANVYGYAPGIRFDSVINKFLFDANFNNRIQIHGSGKQSRTFIHVKKLVDILIDLTSDKVPNGTYNAGDINCSLLDLVDIFKEVYPSLEFIFINQHLQLRNTEMDPNNEIKKYLPIPPVDLKAEIEYFKDYNFAF